MRFPKAAFVSGRSRKADDLRGGAAAVAGLLVLLSGVAGAVPFDDTTAGGTVRVGTGVGSDYATLAAAVAGFNGVTNGINGPWTVLITSDLTEAANLAMGNNVTTDGAVLIKPDAGLSPTITFTAPGNNGGYRGNWLIGTTVLGNYNVAPHRVVKNFTIDGSNNGTSSRDLTIRTAPGELPSNTTVINVVGNADGVTLRNLKIEQLTGYSVDSAVRSVGIMTSSRQQSSNTFIPRNVLIENCHIQSTAGIRGFGIVCDSTKSGTAVSFPAGSGQTGIAIRNNLIETSGFGIFLHSNAGGEVTNNVISVNHPGPSDISGIYHDDSLNTTGWTMLISGNRISMKSAKVDSENAGMTVLNLAGAPTGTANNGLTTYLVTNNFISDTGFLTTTTTLEFCRLRAVSVADSTPNLKLYNNSISIPEQTNLASTTNTAAVVFAHASYAGTADLKNNIIRLGEAGAVALETTGTGTITSDHNNLFVENGALAGRDKGTDAATLAAWQTLTGLDAASTAADPLNPSTPGLGQWVSATDLHFTAKPDAAFAGVPLPEVTTDIDGDARGVTVTYKGADERSESFAAGVADWSVYRN